MDKLSIPFGVIIGPSTVISNLCKAVWDVAKIAFYGLVNNDFLHTDNYHRFKAADLVWEKEISPKHKPQFDEKGIVEINSGMYVDPEYTSTLLKSLETPVFFIEWVDSYNVLNNIEKREVAFDQSLKDLYRHVTFMVIGVIRSIPIIGGIGRCIYNACKVSNNSKA